MPPRICVLFLLIRCCYNCCYYSNSCAITEWLCLWLYCYGFCARRYYFVCHLWYWSGFLHHWTFCVLDGVGCRAFVKNVFTFRCNFLILLNKYHLKEKYMAPGWAQRCTVVMSYISQLYFRLIKSSNDWRYGQHVKKRPYVSVPTGNYSLVIQTMIPPEASTAIWWRYS